MKEKLPIHSSLLIFFFFKFFFKFQNQLTVMTELKYIFGSVLQGTIEMATIEGQGTRERQYDFDEP